MPSSAQVFFFFFTLVAASCAATLVVLSKQPANPLPNQRNLRICIPPELGMLQSSKSVGVSILDQTSDPKIYSASLGNLQEVAGHDVDFLNIVISDYLGWGHEIHVYSSYSSAFYHMRIGACDMAFGAFNAYANRIQCHATPAVGQSWGTITEGCPAYLDPLNSTTTNSYWVAGCCGRVIVTHLQNGFGIIANIPRETSNDRMGEVISSGFVLNWLITLALAILFFGHVVWFMERRGPMPKGEAMFPMSLTQGGQEGIWWAVVTAATVGYGDTSVKKGFARIVAALWMLGGFICMACIIGALASGLSESHAGHSILQPSGIRGKTVCTYSSYTDYLQQYGPILKPLKGVDNVEICWEALKTGSVDAVMYDHKHIMAAVKQDVGLRKFSLGAQFGPHSQNGFVPVDGGTPHLQDRLDWAVAKLLEDQSVVAKLHDTWFRGDEEDSSIVKEEVSQMAALLATCVWLVYIFLQLLALNTPWTDALRAYMTQIKCLQGTITCLFGTDEERAYFKTLHAVSEGKWNWVPQGCKPALEEDDAKVAQTGDTERRDGTEETQAIGIELEHVKVVQSMNQIHLRLQDQSSCLPPACCSRNGTM